MSLQNFFVESDNYKRKTPAICSGKKMSADFRVRHRGESKSVIRVYAVECDNKVLHTHVTVTSPITGEVLFDRIVLSDK